jgi:molecular chaperone HtpG
MHDRDGRRGLQLYVQRVHVLDNCDTLLPDYLRFVKGIVDAQDLSLNLSRESLQQDRRLHTIRRRLTKRILFSLKEIMSSEPDRYRTIWQEYGQVLKEGLLHEYDHRAALIEILQFQSTHHPVERTTLQQYVDRMADDQEAIYYLVGESRAAAENSPHLEALREKGHEVLLLSESIDGFVIGAVPQFAGKPLRSAASGEREAGNTDEEDETPPPDTAKDQFGDMLSGMGTVLGNQVKAVRLSDRLTTSAARIVTDRNDAFLAWDDRNADAVRKSRILELNPQHDLVTALRTAFERSPGEPSPDLIEMIELVHGVAMIADGGDLDDPAWFARAVSNRLARTL